MAESQITAKQIIDIVKTAAVDSLGDTSFPMCINFIEVLKQKGSGS